MAGQLIGRSDLGQAAWDHEQRLKALERQTFGTVRGVFQCTSTDRPADGRRTVGMRIWETDTSTELLWNGSDWVIMWEPLQTWVPTLTQGVTVTKNVLQGTYRRAGGVCRATFVLSVTSGGTAGQMVRVGLPVASSGNPAGLHPVIGVGFVYSGTTLWVATMVHYTNPTVLFQSGVSPWGIVPSRALAAGYLLNATFEYPV